MPNDLFAKLQSDFTAALERETSLRTNYEQGLIPQLERDLQAARRDVTALTVERDALLAWKQRSLFAFSKVEHAHDDLVTAIDALPGDPPVA